MPQFMVGHASCCRSSTEALDSEALDRGTRFHLYPAKAFGTKVGSGGGGGRERADGEMQHTAAVSTFWKKFRKFENLEKVPLRRGCAEGESQHECSRR